MSIADPFKTVKQFLTSKQSAFVAFWADGMKPAAAAAAAGFSNKSAVGLRVCASRLSNDPRIIQAAFEYREKRLKGDLSNVALSCVAGIIADESAPPAARFQAARFILESAGHGIENRRLLARHPDDGSKGLSELSIPELEELVTRKGLEVVRLAQGKVIDLDADGEGD